jgi:hypothetical protein
LLSEVSKPAIYFIDKSFEVNKNKAAAQTLVLALRLFDFGIGL